MRAEHDQEPGGPPLLEVRDLRVTFQAPDGEPVRAVDGVSFSVQAGETVALVGESGSGKSVTALALARLLPATAEWTGGDVRVEGESVRAMPADALRRLRGGRLGYVFQEPTSSLNPVFTAGDQIAEAVRAHGLPGSARAEAVRLMRLVGLPDPERRQGAYPHELSGGMQQRVMIAMALACRPRLLVADEPTTALDVTIQAQILELLAELQAQLGMAILLITHNLGLVARLAGRVLVMYAGRLVESGPTRAVLDAPRHPYTQALLRAVPRLRGGPAPAAVPAGDGRDDARPAGCPFHPRCPKAAAVCAQQAPGEENAGGERTVRCHFWK